MFKKVAIVGTGLIGGSIALDIKRKGLSAEVVGVSRRGRSLALAVKLGVIDRGSRELEIIRGADFVILAAPVEAILKMAPAIARIAGRDCLVTDVGSTKKKVAAALSKLFANYIGSHPLAGSEKRGVENAKPGIFKDSLCILTPQKSARAPGLMKIRSFWRSLGGRVALMPADEHDRILAFTSHLPHAAAFSLMNSIPAELVKFGASGLKDTTRLASSDPGLWADIFLSNSKNVAAAIARLAVVLSAMRSALARGDRRALTRMLAAAKKKRDSIKA